MRDFDRKISVKEMQIQDKNSTDYGIRPATLMECAGYSAAQTLIHKCQLKKGNHVIILCGTGNNGGDGFVIARHLLAAQMNVSLYLSGHPDHIRTNEAKHNWDILGLLYLNLQTYIIKDSSFFDSLSKERVTANKKCKVVVDCLLGTGIKGKVREPIRSSINFINSFSETSTKIVSIDVPSGIDPNTGEKADYWVQSDLLITFHQEKLGFKKIDTEIIVNPIGIPIDTDLFVGSGDIQFSIPKRVKSNHKGQHGKVLIIGGSSLYSGAPALAGMAALQMGIDLVYIFAPKSVADVIRTYSPNLIVRSGVEDNLCWKDVPKIKELLGKVDAVVLGPGLGTDSETEKAFPYIISLLKEKNKPTVIDADAIRLCKLLKAELKELKVVITPHKNEYQELTGKKLPDQKLIQKRIKSLEKTASDWGTTFLVKGRYDYISNGNISRINKTGVPEMAVGGTGDILTGIVASLLSLRVGPFDAACCAAFLNGKLGEFYQNYHKGTIKKGTPLKSSDLLEFIPIVLREYT